MTTRTGGHELPVLKLFSGPVRQSLVQFALDHPNNEQFTKKDAVRATEASNASVRQNVELFVRFGIFVLLTPDANIPSYSCDTEVMDKLQSWHDEGRYPLVKLFKHPGRRNLVKFFLNTADPSRSYSKAQIGRDSDIGYMAISNNIDVLVDAGLLETVDGKRGTEFTLNPDSDLAEFLPVLNDDLDKTFQERSGQISDTR